MPDTPNTQDKKTPQTDKQGTKWAPENWFDEPKKTAKLERKSRAKFNFRQGQSEGWLRNATNESCIDIARAPEKSFKANFPDDHTKELLSKKICRRPRKNRFPPQVLPYDDMRDDIDVAIDNIDNGENNLI